MQTLSPKGSAWLVYNRAWKGGGFTTNWAFVYDYRRGLTAVEAWHEANLAGNPPFCEVELFQLQPYTGNGGLSVDTKAIAERSATAFEKLRPVERETSMLDETEWRELYER
jgi:hypothetical protein